MEAATDAGLVAAALHALEQSWFGAAARRSSWIYPLASVLHIFGLALLLGAIGLFDLRVLGAARRLPLQPTMAFLLPLARAGFAIQLVTGFVMFATDASHIQDNPFFRIKLALIAIALLNIALFHGRLGRDRDAMDWDAPPAWAKAGAAISLAAWFAVAACGRMIAYV